jgi:hypothetical protein
MELSIRNWTIKYSQLEGRHRYGAHDFFFGIFWNVEYEARPDMDVSPDCMPREPRVFAEFMDLYHQTPFPEYVEIP